MYIKIAVKLLGIGGAIREETEVHLGAGYLEEMVHGNAV